MSGMRGKGVCPGMRYPPNPNGVERDGGDTFDPFGIGGNHAPHPTPPGCVRCIYFMLPGLRALRSPDFARCACFMPGLLMFDPVGIGGGWLGGLAGEGALEQAVEEFFGFLQAGLGLLLLRLDVLDALGKEVL
jgi:hypothetical protein